MIEVRLLGPDDAAVLLRVADDVFDNPVDPDLASEHLADPRHHLAVAIDDGTVVGMATALHHVHPDKPPELWVAEVGVAPSHRQRGLGRSLLAVLFEHGHALGCREAWVLTDSDNAAARALYRSVGGREEPPPVMLTFSLGGRREPGSSS